MLFLSFFKTPSPRKFEFTPRFYDPVKEEIAQRTAQIKQEMGLEETEPDERTSRQMRMKMAFRQKNTTHTPLTNHTPARFSVASLRLRLMGWLAAAFFGYLYYGNTALYLLLLIGAIYIYWLVRKK